MTSARGVAGCAGGLDAFLRVQSASAERVGKTLPREVARHSHAAEERDDLAGTGTIAGREWHDL